MNFLPDSKLLFKIARSSEDAAIFALEAYKIILTARYRAAETALKAAKAYNSTTAVLNRTFSPEKASVAVMQKNEKTNENIIDKENPTMKKSCIWGVIAFLAAVAAAVVAVMLYLKKKEQNLAEYEEMLYSEDYLADYMPEEECDCCCEEAEEEFCCPEQAEGTCCCEEENQ